MLVLEQLVARRANRDVLHGIGAEIRPGALTAVIGPNGAGKSTLLQLAAGLEAPQSGRVLLDGTDLRQIPPRKLAQRRAYLPQNPRVDWPLSVERVVALGLTPALPAFGGVPDALAKRVRDTLASYQLQPLRQRAATTLSGGELTRTMLARTTVGAPQLLIVDEPTTGLDPRHALEAMRHLQAAARHGCAVLIAIHDLGLARQFADRILALRDGRLLASGATADTFTTPILQALYDLPARLVGGAVQFCDERDEA